jgi:hypothetical protein
MRKEWHVPFNSKHSVFLRTERLRYVPPAGKLTLRTCLASGSNTDYDYGTIIL